MPPSVRRRLLLVPLANGNHGKTSLVTALLEQGERRSYDKAQKRTRMLITPSAQEVDAYVFVRSFQEDEAKSHSLVVDALDANDPHWRERDLVILPSHCVAQDCAAIITAAHDSAFDAVVVSIVHDRLELAGSADCLALPWDERWVLDNPKTDEWVSQVAALGRDLWVAVSRALFPAS